MTYIVKVIISLIILINTYLINQSIGKENFWAWSISYYSWWYSKFSLFIYTRSWHAERNLLKINWNRIFRTVIYWLVITKNNYCLWHFYWPEKSFFKLDFLGLSFYSRIHSKKSLTEQSLHVILILNCCDWKSYINQLAQTFIPG